MDLCQVFFWIYVEFSMDLCRVFYGFMSLAFWHFQVFLRFPRFPLGIPGFKFASSSVISFSLAFLKDLFSSILTIYFWFDS